MTDINILEKLEQILESDAKNYFESSERLSLMNKSLSKNAKLIFLSTLSLNNML